MRHKIFLSLLVAFAVFAVGAGDVNTRPTWPSTVQGSMLVDAITPFEINKDLDGWYPLEEGSGTTAGDVSGNGNDASLINTPTWVTGLIGEYALDFNGSTEYSNLGYSIDLTDTPFTISFFFKSNTSGRKNGLFSHLKHKPTSPDAYRGVNISVYDDGTFRIRLRKDTDNYEFLQTTTTDWNDGSIRHASIVYEADGTAPILYRDGSSHSMTSTGSLGDALSGINVPTTLPMIFGAADQVVSPNTVRAFGDVVMDDVRVYLRALTADEADSIARGLQ